LHSRDRADSARETQNLGEEIGEQEAELLVSEAGGSLVRIEELIRSSGWDDLTFCIPAVAGSARSSPAGVYEDQSGSMSARWIHDFLGDGDGGDHSATRTALGLGATAHPISYWSLRRRWSPYWDWLAR